MPSTMRSYIAHEQPKHIICSFLPLATQQYPRVYAVLCDDRTGSASYAHCSWLLAALLLSCRVVPLFRGYTGQYCEGAYEVYLECADDDWLPGWENRNFGRPLQPAQQLEPLTSEPNAYWALMVASFSTCTGSMQVE
jgi:hypothetical protein